MRIEKGSLVYSDDKDLLQIEVIQGFLDRSYWAAARPRETVLRSIENSICYGVYAEEEGGGCEQVAFARVVTDYASVWWLCDVFVDERYRGRGIGKELVRMAVEDPRLRGIRGILATRDAHGLYEQFGFERVPDRFMRRAAAH